MTSAVALARASVAQHSKSFALASRLLPGSSRDTARIVYAWCRRADDAIDLAPQENLANASDGLLAELDDLYAGRAARDPIVAAFGEVIRKARIPELYPRELLLGMRMDVEQVRYETWDDLLLYCHRVAGTVGLMMCHVLGVKDARALKNAAHLGIAMQLTNIARDVAEDWRRGRLYVPDEVLAAHGAPQLARHLGTEIPAFALPALSQGVRHLLERAQSFYESADVGILALEGQSAWAVATARAVYSEIGRELAQRSFAVDTGRAHVSKARKLYLAVRSGLPILWRAASRSRFSAAPLETPLRFPHDILPI